MMYKFFCLTVVVFWLGVGEASARPRVNPITSHDRLWLEWNVTPNVQWAPGLVDPEADPDRTLNVLKLQPVFPFRLNEDWTVLTRTIFRFVSSPSATPT